MLCTDWANTAPNFRYETTNGRIELRMWNSLIYMDYKQMQIECAELC